MSANYSESAPTDEPQPLARPISQEGRLGNTPFQTQRSYADQGIPRGQDRQDYMDAIKALEEQIGRKLTSKERDAFLRTGSIPEAPPAEPTPVSDTALRDAFGNLLAGSTPIDQEEMEVEEDIASAPFVGQQRANLGIPTAGSSGLRGAAPFQFQPSIQTGMGMGMGRFRPRVS